MPIGRFFLMTLGALCLVLLLHVPADAGFGFGSDDVGKSGLDLNQGYDINTVTTVAGRVVVAPRQGEKDQFIVEIASASGLVNVSIGPATFWQSKGVPVSLNDELSAKGSLAQGEDGKTYLLAQKLVNKTTGSQVELRNEKGVPSWSGRGMGSTRSGRSQGGMRSHGGAMMRGGGMMRR
mgnify:CR=1 FL=1